MADKKTVNINADADYQARIAAAKAGKIPVGSVPLPPIPRFDSTPPDRFQGVQAAATNRAAKKLLSPEEIEKLRSENNFVPGVGSAYAANQPAVTRGPAPQAPTAKEEYQNPPRPEGGLRQETVEGLKALAEANSEKTAKEEAKEDTADDMPLIEDHDISLRNLLSNKRRRDAIESRCTPMAVEDLIIHGEVRQEVVIAPGKFFPTFRSVQGHEDLFVKKLMGNERGADQFIIDLFTLRNLTCGLHALNGKVLPSHLKSDGEPDEKLFEAKFKIVSRMPSAMLADLSVNYIWFVNRLEKLFVVDQIKGF